MSNRLSQLPVEILVQPDALPPARISQLPVEILVAPVPIIGRLAQLPVEVGLLSDAPITIKFSQAPLEVGLLSDAPITIKLSQAPLEVLVVEPPPVNFEIAGDYIGLTWVEWTLDAPVIPARASLPLPVPAVAPTSLAVLSANYVTFLKQGGTGVQTVTGVGFRGKALLLWTTRQATHGTATGAAQMNGITDGVKQSVRFIHHPGGETATTSSQAERTDCIAFMVTATSGATPSVEVRGVFGAWTTDGFTINWTANDGAGTLLHALVLGGPDIQVAMKQVKINVGLNQTIAVTGVGFQPDSFIVMGGAADESGSGDYNLGAPFGSIHGFGFSNAVQNISSWTLGRGTGGGADTFSGLHTDRAASIRTANLSGAGELCGVQITATGPDGFTVTRRDSNAGHQPIQHILCIKGAAFTLGTFTSPATVGNYPIALTFAPGLALVQTHQSSSLNTTISGLHLMIGAWVNGAGQGGTWVGGRNGSPSMFQRSSYEGNLIQARREDTLAVTCEAMVASASTAGLMLDFSVVPSPAITFIYLVLGSVSTPQIAFSGKGDIAGTTVGLTWVEWTLTAPVEVTLRLAETLPDEIQPGSLAGSVPEE